MKMAILGAGRIAGTMAQTISKMPQVETWAVASRNLERAQMFARQYGFQHAYGSYEELVSDPEVDLIYIATPHSHHYEHAKLCVLHGKNALVEKSFTQNAQQAKEVLALAEANGVLVTEAMWTRYIPMRKTLDEVLASGVIGKPQSLYATLSYAITDKERMVDPKLAGGALLDIGVYTLNFASMVFGDDIRDVHATALLTNRGVDAVDSITLTYPDGRMAVLHSDMRAEGNREGAIYGEKGYIMVKNINNCEGIRVYNANHELIAEYETPEQITGYEYEVQSCMRAIADKAVECPEMPHAETLFIMELMDQIRAQIGVAYPNE